MKPNKNKRQCYSEVFIRQKQFNNRYLQGQQPAQYEALLDPHTMYYFSNKSVRKHLKTMKRSLKFQKKTSQQFHISNLIDQKIKQKVQFPKSKTNIYGNKLSKLEKQSLQKLANFSIKPIISSYLYEPRQTQKQYKTVNINPQINQQTSSLNIFSRKKSNHQPTFKSTYKPYANHLFQQLHQKKHTKWADFLYNKMKEFESKQSKQKQAKQ